MSNHRIGHTLIANERRERPRIKTRNADDPARLKPRIEMPRRTKIGGLGNRGMDNHAPHARCRCHIQRFNIFVIDADIADMGKSESNDLAGIGRIGQDFLIARHGRVEANLARRDPLCANPEPFEHGAIGEHEERCRARFRPSGRCRSLILLHRHFGPKPCGPDRMFKQARSHAQRSGIGRYP